MRILKTLSHWLGLGSTPQPDRSAKDQDTPKDDTSKDDKVEYVEAEVVDPTLPPDAQDGDAPEDASPPLGLGGQIKAWFARKKLAIYHFFVPPPMLVPAQLKTPEIDLQEMQQPQKLKGFSIYAIIGFFFVAAVVWAALAEIDEVVRAEGAVVPSDNVQVVQSRLPGSVIDITASLGDRVRKGDVLFRLEDEDVVANFDDNEIERRTAQAAIIRLEAEREERNTVQFPDELTQHAPDIVAQEIALFNSRKAAKQGELDVLVQETESLKRAIQEKQAEADLATRQLLTINKERDIIAPLVEKGFEPRITLLNIDARIEAEAGRKELAELAVNRMQSDLEAQARKLASLENRYRADAETQLVEMRTRAAQAEARLAALKGKVAYTDVKAPSDGIISAVHIKTIGAVVDAGAVMAEIVPDEKEVTVRAQVLTDDVAKISPGQKVRVSLSAYDVSRYGALEGEVEKIASNSTQDENLPPYFVTMIKIPDPVYPNSGFAPEITPGMTAIIDVIGGKRTILQYILSPIERAQQIAFREK